MAPTMTDKELRQTIASQKERLAHQRSRHKRYKKGELTLRRRVARTRNRIKNLRKRREALHASKGKRLVQTMQNRYEGHTEKPANSNDSPFLARFRSHFPNLAWMKGQPWCGFFIMGVVYELFKVRMPDGFVYTPNIKSWAQNKQNGFRIISAAEAKMGDFVLFDFPGGENTDHVGTVIDVANGRVKSFDGNTSPSNAGSQANGGGAWTRDRGLEGTTFVRYDKING